MQTTRRGWLTAFTSLIALPVLPKAAQGSKPDRTGTTPNQAIAQLLAGQSFAGPSDDEDDDSALAGWREAIRQPLTPARLRAREESIRNDLHDARVRGTSQADLWHLKRQLEETQHARAIARLIHTGQPVCFDYKGGSNPGKPRTVLPTSLFELTPCLVYQGDVVGDCPVDEFNEFFSDRIYLEAYCLERLAPRVFRLDRIRNVSPLPASPTLA